jgi:hypothetical protein
VTAGAPSRARPAKGCMYCWYAVTDALTLMQAEPVKQTSGSLKDIRAGAPALMAVSAAVGQARSRLAALL